MKLDTRKKFLEKAKAQVKTSYERKDSVVIQAARAIDDLDNARSLLAQRLNEWVRINFPEFPVQSDEMMARVYAQFGCKEDFEPDGLAEITGAKEKAEKIMERREKSFGTAFNLEDKQAVQELAKVVATAFEARKELESYVDSVAKREMPNLSALAEPLLAARLLSLAGSLQNLAEMPASTVQVIGAERALFKHLREGTRPPKHGIIFQHVSINNAPVFQRGRIARTLAGKLAIAAKADFYTKRNIAEKLKADFEKQLARIKAAPERKKEYKPFNKPFRTGRPFKREGGFSRDRPQFRDSRPSGGVGGKPRFNRFKPRR